MKFSFEIRDVNFEVLYYSGLVKFIYYYSRIEVVKFMLLCGGREFDAITLR